MNATDVAFNSRGNSCAYRCLICDGVYPVSRLLKNHMKETHREYRIIRKLVQDGLIARIQRNSDSYPLQQSHSNHHTMSVRLGPSTFPSQMQFPYSNIPLSLTPVSAPNPAHYPCAMPPAALEMFRGPYQIGSSREIAPAIEYLSLQGSNNPGVMASGNVQRICDILSPEEDLAELVKSVEGLYILRHGAEPFGVNVVEHPLETSTGFDFGLRFYDDLEKGDTDIGVPPVGYKTCEFSSRRGKHINITLPLSLQLRCDELTESVTLDSFTLHPSVSSSMDLSVDILDAFGVSLLCRKIDLRSTTSGVISLVFSEDYRGYFRAMLILHFRIAKKVSRTCRAAFICTVGLLLRGGILSGVSKRLSSEAVPFVPKYFKDIFNPPAAKFYSIFSLPRGRFDVRVPIGFASKATRVSVLFQPTEQFEKFYFEFFSCPPDDMQRKAILSDAHMLNIMFPIQTCEDSECLRYLTSLGHLLLCEEIQMKEDIKNYDMFDVPLEFQPHPQAPQRLVVTFRVKGSNESRPAIFVGDSVRIRPSIPVSREEDIVEIVGVIKKYTLSTEEVVCEFPLSSFSADIDSDIRYHVRFTFERSGIALIRQALEVIKKNRCIRMCIFPSSNLLLIEKNKALKSRPLDVDEPSCTQLEMSCIDQTDMTLNPEQRLATKSIVYLYEESKMRHESGEFDYLFPPFVIFGPPGTGKTLTVTATILELHRTHPDCRILVCAPSDAAADVLCERLQRFYGTKQLFRLLWWQRSAAAASKVLSFSYKDEDDVFDLPPREVMMQFSVVISTCSISGCLGQDSVCDPFDVVIIDEASQAIEAEAMVPISLSKTDGIVVIAGDPDQLGPSPRSPMFKITSIFSSLLDRLLNSDLYQHLKDCSDGLKPFRFGTFLRRNYRSHRDIFSVSSKLFYGDALIESGDPDNISSLLDWNPPSRYIVSRSLQVVPSSAAVHFIAIDGQHAHELDSPSFYNLFEIEAVVQVCLSLVSLKGTNPADIGVIAAFRSQVLKLRMALRHAGLSLVNVGNVMDLQGQEMKVVIVSTVLTSRIRSDCRDSIGLLGDHRKFNVAITRGMALCIVVGDPHILYDDVHWAAYIELCDSKGTFHGSKFHRLRRFKDAQDLKDAESLLEEVARSVTQAPDDTLESGSSRAMFTTQQYFADELIWNTFLQR